MIYKLLKNAIARHLEETRLLFNQITDHIVLSEPVQLSRPLGEIILHLIHSIEYYLRGAATDVWGEPLPFLSS